MDSNPDVLREIAVYLDQPRPEHAPRSRASPATAAWRWIDARLRGVWSTLRAMLQVARMKLHPGHRRLAELEIRNVQDWFASELVPEPQRRRIGRLRARWMTYVHAIRRITGISAKARQDYLALNGRAEFVAAAMPACTTAAHPSSRHAPIVIIPGLRTPPMFFREMHDWFVAHGYNVLVADLPGDGYGDVVSCAEALRRQIDTLRKVCGAPKVDVIGHCLGGLIAKYAIEEAGTRSIRRLISLGTGFRGSDGVKNLKDFWVERNPGEPIPPVFDELIEWNRHTAQRSTEVVYHSVLTIWDFIVHFRKGLLKRFRDGKAYNLIITDPSIDHLTLALDPRVFRKIDELLSTSFGLTPAPPTASWTTAQDASGLHPVAGSFDGTP